MKLKGSDPFGTFGRAVVVSMAGAFCVKCIATGIAIFEHVSALAKNVSWMFFCPFAEAF